MKEALHEKTDLTKPTDAAAKSQFGRGNVCMSPEQIKKTLMTALEIKPGEKVLFLTDKPEKPEIKGDKEDMRDFLKQWYAAAQSLATEVGFELLPLVTYLETGAPSAPLPQTAFADDGKLIEDLTKYIGQADVVIAINWFSATGPLKDIGTKNEKTRGLTMPQVDSSMASAILVDYNGMAQRCNDLLDIVKDAVGFEIEFKGEGVPPGTKLYVDMRAKNWHVSSGKCTTKGMFGNLPGAEDYSAPYEGIYPGAREELGDSKTEGTWAVYSPPDNKVVLLTVKNNMIVDVEPKDAAKAQEILVDIEKNPNNANVAEIGFGLNKHARSSEDIRIIEKEKAEGMHLANGTDSHFGGPDPRAGVVTGSVHNDWIYTPTTAITATTYAVYADGSRRLIVEDGRQVAV